MDRKIKGRRVLLFFIFAFGSIALPTIGSYIYIWLAGISDAAVSDFFDAHLIVILESILGYYLALIPVWSYFATWASRIEAVPGASPLPKEELIAKLLLLNNPKLPWQIRRGEREDLIAEWKIVDEKWIDIFAANKISLTHRLRFRLDGSRHISHVQDVERRVSWRVGVGGSPVADFSFSGHRGIDFYQYEWGAAYGVVYKDGQLKIGEAYKYRFVLQEMKNPLIEAIIENGWTWQGALSVSPFWSIIFGG